MGELTDVYDGTHQTPQYTDDGIMFLSVENIKTLQSQKYISEEAFKTEFKVFPEKGDVLMTRIGDIGTANVFESNEPTAYYVSLALLKCKELDPYFLKESIYSETVKKDLWHRTLHIAFPKKINKNEIEKVQIPYPDSRLEQERIGTFFRNLDNLITLHQREREFLYRAYFGKISKIEEITPTWEQRKYRDTFTSLPNNTLARAELNYNSGSAKNVHYGDVLIKFGELLNVREDEIPYITNGSLADKFKSSKLQNGDVIVADAAEDETVGKCTELVNIGEEILVSGLHTIPCRPIISFASGYLGYFMNSSSYHDQLLKLMQGTKVSSISKSALQDTDITFPIDIVEQKQISDYFQQLNNLITLHQREYEFIGRINFEIFFSKSDYFTSTWEQRKVKDVCEISTGKSNTQDRIEDGIYPFYVRSPIIERSNRYLYDEEAVLTVGDGVGTGKVYHYVNGKYDLHQRVYRMFDFKNGALAKYFYHHFSNHFYDRVMAMTAKTSVDSVRYEMISEMDIEMPSEKEQAKIIDYLDNLDTLITLHQRKPQIKLGGYVDA